MAKNPRWLIFLDESNKMNLRLELQILTKEAQQKLKTDELPDIYSIRHEMNKKAQLITEQIPQNARTAARKGLNSVKVMDVSWNEYDVHQHLKGIPYIVWNRCFNYGLNPSIKHTENGYAIFVSWQ